MDYEEAPGFRFFPTEEELISFYLQEKLKGGRQDLDRVIPVLCIYDYHPWDLPKLAGERCKKDQQLEEWFFFIPRQEKEARGGRPSRLTTSGYWKATGSPGWVYSSDQTQRVIGVKRTMVFYRGRARTRRSGLGSKTEWKMNEYLVIDPADQPPSPSPTNAVIQKGDFTVCRVYKKTKCLRAFDRRPAAPPTVRPGPHVSSAHHQAVDHHQQQQQPTPSDDHQENQQRSTVEIEASSSDQSSPPSSGDHANNSTIFDFSLDGFDQNNYMGIEIDQAPLWDWDSLHTLYWSI